MNLRIILDGTLAASAWTELTEYRYSFTYGYRKQLYTICLSFSAQDFPHLAGFQYLKDIQLPKFNPPKAVEMILSGKIKYDTVQKAHSSIISSNLDYLLSSISRILLRTTLGCIPSCLAFTRLQPQSRRIT